MEILDFVEETAVAGRARVYCVMEMLEGQSLTELLARERPSVARAVGIVRQVCDALQAAHDVGVIHRDVKPDNLFVLERDGQDFVKVLDFGVAKLVAPLGDVPMTTTVEGTIVGTPAYMAPEQATGGNADARTDLYSVGVVLYELLAGHPPFQAPAFGQLVAQVLSSPPPPLPACARNGERIPGALWAVVRRCLAKNPDDRYPSLRALARALENRGPGPGAAGPTALGGRCRGARRAGDGCGRRGPSDLASTAAGGPSGGDRSAGGHAGRAASTDRAGPGDRAGSDPGAADGGARIPRARAWWTPRPGGRSARRRCTSPSSARARRPGSAWSGQGDARREVEVVPDSPREVHVTLPRAPRSAPPTSGKVARGEKHPDPFKL